jgi:hypothetical protein
VSDHGQLWGLTEGKGEKVLHVHYLGGLEKCWARVTHSHEGLVGGARVVCVLLKWYRELEDGTWFAWVVVMCEKTNG